ncbi:MAG: LysM peptidoglycan-binding domain-containing protein [Caldilineaceae bacterium]|nr:LysM peptidoglycan-binding domain-containing protein [Caldilineaceae bacterium]
MNRNHRAPHFNSDDLFAEAVTRLEAGEAIDKILASYPAAMRDELFDMLSIVQVARELGQTPIPRPSAARRAAAKQNFLAAAAQMREEQQRTASVPSVTASSVTAPSTTAQTPRSVPRRKPPARASLWERFAGGFQSIFSNRSLRLAPMILALALVLLSTSTLVTMAQTAVPGDLAYSFKQWIRKQELELAPPDRRALVRQEQERELAADVARAAERADQNSAIIQAEDTQVYYGRNGRLLKIGGLTVVDRYQPDANVETFKPMTVEGDLQPGAQVKITYQILPGQSDTVQGIALTVVAPPAETTGAQPGQIEVIQPQVVGCTVNQPEGWVPYEVKAGDNLTFLAMRGGTTVDKLMQANCLEGEIILIGAKLYVPADSLKTDGPLLHCGAQAPKDWMLYEVQPGDNLTAIAERSGVTVTDIMSVNCLDNDTILIGSQLYIPSATPTP